MQQEEKAIAALVSWARQVLAVMRSEATRKTYGAVLRRLRRAQDLVGKSRNGRTRRLQRAALRYLLARNVVAAHDAGDQRQLLSLAQIKHGIDHAADVASQEMHSGGIDNKIRRKTKKLSLSGLPSDWRVIFLNHARQLRGGRPSRYFDAMAILAGCGCRPSELELGVHVGLDDTGQDLVFTICGTKVNDSNGHRVRVLTLARNTPLSALVPLGFVKAPAKALNDAVVRIGKVVFPGRGPDRQISPYTFRHAAAGDFKRSGGSDVEVAGALGHRSTRTKGMYARRRGVGGQRLLAAKCSDDVRDHPSSEVPESLAKKDSSDASGKLKKCRSE